ncbi:MAG: HIT family protein [Lachnospiraceae bacterium]|nr:HIT family protein [Lachnospiraceae bacterium]
MKDDCIFCKLANGIIPTKSIYEDELFNVIMDAEPATKGHVLIIPKKHYDSLFDLGDEEAKAIMPLAKKLATKIKADLSADGYNLVQNNGEIANQTVKHFHLHLIPRYEGDCNQGQISWNHVEITEEEMNEVYQIIK